MKVIKNINNNVSICLDSQGVEVVAFGKGLGFCKPPYDLNISKIERTFYDIDPTLIQMIQGIPEGMLELSTRVLDFARFKVEYALSSNIAFTLADHLAFALQRYEKNMMVEMPIYYDVKSLYEKEYEVGEFAICCIYEKFQVKLPKTEAVGVALHLINATAATQTHPHIQESHIILKVKKIVENHFNISISEDDFNYSRFVSHMQYLLKRVEKGGSISSENAKMYETLKNSFPEIYACVCKINEYLHSVYGYFFDDEESMYLILHINRLCARESDQS